MHRIPSDKYFQLPSHVALIFLLWLALIVPHVTIVGLIYGNESVWEVWKCVHDIHLTCCRLRWKTPNYPHTALIHKKEKFCTFSIIAFLRTRWRSTGNFFYSILYYRRAINMISTYLLHNIFYLVLQFFVKFSTRFDPAPTIYSGARFFYCWVINTHSELLFIIYINQVWSDYGL